MFKNSLVRASATKKSTFGLSTVTPQLYLGQVHFLNKWDISNWQVCVVYTLRLCLRIYAVGWDAMSIRIILSASSDIGISLATSWIEAGHVVFGTFRNRTTGQKLRKAGVASYYCNLNSFEATRRASKRLARGLLGRRWSVLVMAAGTQNPVGLFRENKFAEWEDSISVNFTRQVQFLHALLPHAEVGAQVIFFAGGGTNGIVDRYSSYTISKIASIKLCELLAAEEPHLKFTSIGPGWVRTKIHQETLDAGLRAGENWEKTKARLASGNFFPIEKLSQRIEWIVESESEVVSGRNFSAVSDPFENPSFKNWLVADQNRFKLRRHANEPNFLKENS